MTRFPRAPAPRGAGSPRVESLTGYLQRTANEHAVPTSRVFVGELLPVFRDRQLYRGHDRDIVRHHARAINGAGIHAQAAVEIMSELTGRGDLASLSFLTVADVGKIANNGIVARGKRWCPRCWADDGAPEDRYERKVWNLSVADACAVHRVALMERCPGCGLPQPAIASDVLVGVCSHCGRDLGGAPLALGPPHPGSEAARRLWYAEQAAALVHATEAVDMLGISKESLNTARRAGLRALAAHLERGGDREGVLGQVQTWSESANRPSIEALYSVLWQARWPVARLFPEATQSAVAR